MVVLVPRLSTPQTQTVVRIVNSSPRKEHTGILSNGHLMVERFYTVRQHTMVMTYLQITLSCGAKSDIF